MSENLDFETLAEEYYKAKNGYIYEVMAGKGDYDKVWCNPNSQKACEIKETLKTIIADGYQVDISNKDSKSAWFIEELEHEKLSGKPYRRNDEYYIHLENGKAVGECRVPLNFYVDRSPNPYSHFNMGSHLQEPGMSYIGEYNDWGDRHCIFYKIDGVAQGYFENGKFTGNVSGTVKQEQPNGAVQTVSLESHYKDGLLDGSYEEHILNANSNLVEVPGERKLYGIYENGKFIEGIGYHDWEIYNATMKRRIYEKQRLEYEAEKKRKQEIDAMNKYQRVKRKLDDIEQRRQAREEKLEGKKLPKVIKDIGKAGFKIDSKIQAAIAVKEAQKDGRK